MRLLIARTTIIYFFGVACTGGGGFFFSSGLSFFVGGAMNRLFDRQAGKPTVCKNAFHGKEYLLLLLLLFLLLIYERTAFFYICRVHRRCVAFFFYRPIWLARSTSKLL